MSKQVAVLGCGYWGKNLVRNFHAIGALGAVCDPSEGGRALAAEIAPGVPVHADPEAVFTDGSIDGVAIATPAVTHAKVTEQAIAAGKDVLCEKPLALRLDDARRVAQLAQERQRILMVGHILEYHPGVLELRKIIESGELGEILYIHSSRLSLGKVRVEENVLWSFAPHDIAVILRLAGRLPSRVSASGSAFVSADVEDVTLVQLSFSSGLGAHIFVSWLNPVKEQKLVVIGSRKMASFDDVAGSLTVHEQRVDDRGGTPVPFRGDDRAVEYSKDAEPLRNECAAFLDAMTTRAQPLTDSRSALQVLHVLEAAQQSLDARGEPISLSVESSAVKA